MPLYEYQCPKCGRFEVIRKFSDSPLTSCPTCGKDIQKLLSAPAIQFKGTGWYITDYARKSSGGDGASKGTETTAPSGAAAGDAGASTPAKAASKDGPATGSSPTK